VLHDQRGGTRKDRGGSEKEMGEGKREVACRSQFERWAHFASIGHGL
jgi:hypothetical protein